MLFSPMLIGCGLRRAEILKIKVEDFALREEPWVLPTSSAKAVTCERSLCLVGSNPQLMCGRLPQEFTVGLSFEP